MGDGWWWRRRRGEEASGRRRTRRSPPGGRGLSLSLRLPPTLSFPFCRRADGVEANARRRQSKLSTSLSPRGRGGNVKENARRSFSHGCLRDHRADEAGARGRGGRASGAGHSPEVKRRGKAERRRRLSARPTPVCVKGGHGLGGRGGARGMMLWQWARFDVVAVGRLAVSRRVVVDED